LAREPDRERAVPVDRRDDLPVDLADQHHAGDVERLGIGDAQTVAELRLLAQPCQQLADLRSATVDDDRTQADRPHQHHVGGEQAQVVVTRYRVPAVLDDDDLAAEAADPGQRLDEDGRLLAGLHDVPMFSSTYAWVRSLVMSDASPSPSPRSATTSSRGVAITSLSAAVSWSQAMPSRATTMPP